MDEVLFKSKKRGSEGFKHYVLLENLKNGNVLVERIDTRTTLHMLLQDLVPENEKGKRFYKKHLKKEI